MIKENNPSRGTAASFSCAQVIISNLEV